MVRYQESFVPSGGGIREEHLHVGCGLRNASIDAVLSSVITGVSGVLSGNQVDSTAFLSTRGTSWLGHLPVPMTPHIIGAYVSGATCMIQWRVSGFDQFDNHIVEITPEMSFAASAGQNFQICLSKVFRYVDNIEFRSRNITAVNFAVGWMTAIDPTGIEAAAIDPGLGITSSIKTYSTWKNWGLGTPLRVAPYGTSLPASTLPNFQSKRLLMQAEISGVQVIRLAIRTTAVAQNIIVAPQMGVFGDTAIGNTYFRMGRSSQSHSAGADGYAQPFQGTPHKIGLESTDNWATGFSLAFTGSSSHASGIPLAANQYGEDQLQFIITMRSSLGTRRQSNPESNYVRG